MSTIIYKCKSQLLVVVGILLSSIIIQAQTCDCTDYLYVNDVADGAVYKYAVDPVDGSVFDNPIGNPWLDNIENPHGVAANVNGVLYIGEREDPRVIQKINCDGTGRTESISGANIAGLDYNNFVSKDNILYINGRGDFWVEAYDLCSETFIGNILMNEDEGDDNGDYLWELMKGADGNMYTAAERADSFWIYQVPYDITLYDGIFEVPATIKSELVFTGARYNGFVQDENGFFYVSVWTEDRDSGGDNVPTRIYKLNPDGTVVSFIEDTATNGSGFGGAKGIAYSQKSGKLYVATQDDDCVSVIDAATMTYEAAISIPGGGGKALRVVTECCPDVTETERNLNICDKEIGDMIFLNDIFNCDEPGIICEGFWEEISSTGFTFDQCNLALIVDSPTACGEYRISKGDKVGLQQCDPFSILVNICLSDVTNVTAVPSDCIENGDNDYFTVSVNAETTNPNATGFYRAVIGANANGLGGTTLAIAPYGTPRVLGDGIRGAIGTFEADGVSTYEITIRDRFAPTCNTKITVGPVAVCAECTLTVACSKSDLTNCTPVNGSVTATASGDQGNLTYSWEDNLGNPVGSTATVNNLAAGTYNVTVTDDIEAGCIATCSVTVDDNAGTPTAVCSTTDNTNCDTPNGTASVSTDATNPTYEWNTGATTAAITGLMPGTYTVTVTDGVTGCINMCDAVVGSTTADLSAVCSTTDNTNCDTPNGTASVSTDATNPTYEWSTGATTAAITGLIPGTYTVTVTDGVTGCINMCDAVVGSTTADPSAVCSTTDNTNCDTPNGTASVSTDATNPTYEWSTGATTAAITGLVPGTYTVTVTDGVTGCINMCDAVVGSTTVDPSLACSFIDNTSCTIPNGSVTATASDVSYLWSTGATTATVSNLVAGTYTVTVTDLSTGCTATCSETIADPDGPTSCSVNVDSQPTCANSSGGAVSVNVVGGAMPYSYSWNNGATTATLTGLNGGNYTVTVTDANSCTTICSETLDTPMGCCSIVATCEVVENVSCFGGSDGSATASFTGDQGAVTYLWSDASGQTTATAIGLTAGMYSVTITDDISPDCEDICMVTISEPSEALTCSTSKSDADCALNTLGSITVNGSGGTAPYQYSLEGAAFQPGNTYNDLESGTYEVTIRDDNNCTSICSATIEEVNCVFDLALEKVISATSTGPYVPGGEVTFTIEVTNQGTVDAFNVQLKDYYITEELVLADTDWTMLSSGVAQLNNDINFIGAGEKESVNITFTISEDFQGTTLINYGEISQADDDNNPNNTFPTDADSTPDDNQGDDELANDGELVDSDTGQLQDDDADSDDYDPAQLNVDQEFDLAIRKTYTSWNDTNMDGLISNGEEVTFTVVVFNQGTVDAIGVEVTDYVPTGLSHPDGAAVITALGAIAKVSSATYDIVMTVDPTFMGGMITNNAEITSGTNALGLADEDNPLGVIHGSADDESEVDTDNDTDDEAPGTPGMSDNPNDVDDYDPAQIMVGQVFDLAINKIVNTVATPGPYAPGDEVTYTITIYNQGSLDATNVIVEDYIASGMSFESSPDFSLQGSEYMATVPSLVSGGSTILSITLSINSDFMGLDLTNNAEIIGASNVLGMEDQDNPLSIEHGSSDDESELDTDNDIDDEYPGTPGTSDNPNDVDDYDPAQIQVVQIFDLALEKVFNSSSATPIVPGTDVTFTVEVTNQGTQDAFNVELVDYIPTGLMLNDVNWTEATLGVASLNNDITYIGVGESESVNITFTVMPTFQGTTIINYSEISGADNDNDPTNTPPTDADSTPSDNQGDDELANDGEIVDSDNGNLQDDDADSDDYDPAEITIIQEFDLAIRKTFTSWNDTNMDGFIGVGEEVTFTVGVFNQGTLDATGVEVTDYVPTGLLHPDGATVLTSIGSIAKGTSATYDIVMTVDPTFMGGMLTNNTEITAGTNALGLEDEDNPLNVIHGAADDESEVDTDNDIDDEADGTPGTVDNPDDVDDYDPAPLMIGQTFDLAIVKEINAAETPAPYVPNGLVTFDVTVYNQGSVDATDIIIEDYLPTGTSFESSPDFSLQGAEYLANVATLAAGGSISLEITVRIDSDFMGSSLVNNVEIVSAQNALGLIDQDDDISNVTGSSNDDSELDTDNNIDDEAPGTPGTVDNQDDIDDYDPAFVPVTQTFDLALEKIFNNSDATPVRPGSQVTFTIEVTNQGTLDAYNISLVDYIPTGLTLTDGNWTESTPGIAYLNNDIVFIARGEMESVNITFTVDSDFMGTEITNWAEINQADDNNDPTDGFPIDVDSTPNDDQFSEGGETDDLDDDGVIDEDGNNGGDEDDHDPTLIEITQSFDLALQKVFTSWDDTDMNGMIDQGENVTFTMTVYNQGNLDATDVIVTDYVPTGMIFNAADNSDFSGSTLTPTAGIASIPMGESLDLAIVLQVDPTFMGMSAINNAEITSADNALGQEDEDNPLSVVHGLQDDGSELVTDNDVNDEFPGTPGTIDNPNDVDDYDPVMIMIGQVFDLALFKEYDSYNDLSGDGVLSPSDEVTFLITLVNQGSLDAYNIQVSDYIPDGLTLNDASWNNMQNVDIGQLNTVHPFLAAGESTTKRITFTIDEFWRGTSIVNFAEISAADDNDDPTDGFPTDEDSTPDSIDDNDTFGGDNVIDNINNDEDDHDPAEINPVIEFDLALAKKDQSEDPVTSYGELRTFDIEVTNQGTVLATEFTVVDYIPCGFEFVNTPGVNSGWTYNSNTRVAEFLYDEDILYPTMTEVLTISLEVVYCSGDQYYNWTNYSEISDYDDDFNDFNQDLNDIDSDPDATNFDDAGGEPEGPTDDVIDGDGTGPFGSGVPANDEDDHDPERVEVFDLALSKVISDATPAPYQYYDNITFDIEVTNQGNIGAQNIEVTDYIPEGYVFDLANNSGWSGSFPNPTFVITDLLASKASTTISITLQILQTDGGEKDWINYAEITASENENGEDRTDWDIDSNSGSNGVDENIVEPGDDADNDIDSRDKGGEEDDHDPAGIEVFDLAQNKVTIDDGPFEYGDEVVFTINIFNQGSIEVSNIEITDYIPCGYTFDTFLTSNTENGWTYDAMTRMASNILSDNLSPGETTSVEIILAVTQCIDNDVSSFTNLTEISGADSNDPDEPADDFDSDPDTDPTDDEGGNVDTPEDDHVGDDSTDGNMDGIIDEDDHDPERIKVFDLALKKELVTAGPYAYGDVLEFNITVCNQGNVNAANIVVSDYLPAGYSFEFANNTGWSGTVAEPTFAIPGVLIEDTCIDFPVFMTIVMTDGGEKDWFNYAEITAATDEEGNAVTDADSNPGSNGVDENAVEPGDDVDDDMLSTDKGGEEDDHDPAGIEIYDLAQRKTTNATAPFRYGDDVVFTLEVFNQGSIESSNIELTDYIPCGYEYLASNDANGWSYDATSGNATVVLLNALVPGASTTIDITLRVQQCLDMDELTFTNFTEISNSESNDPDEDPDDIDSDEDEDPENDGPTTDDEITGDPNDPDNPDEDDHDPEEIDVFDLAMIKMLETDGPYGYGDIVEFKFTVCNQGNITAANIVIADYLPVGYTFDFANNPGWGGTIDDPTYTISGTLDEDTCTDFSMFVTIIMTDGGEKDWINYAEIINNTDEEGNPVTDADSNPGSDGSGENAVEPGDDSDDDLESTDLGGEEDDHDPAGIELYDLAQIKTTDDVGPFSYGDFVTFDVTVINQGSIESANIEVTDYIPCGFIYAASNDANGWSYDMLSGNASIIIAGPLSPGSSMTRSITLQIQECYDEEAVAWTNITEISDSESTDPDEDPDDVDSDEDDDPDNDGPSTNDETNGDPDNPDNPDEDDSDPEKIEIFDLATRKFIEDKGPYGPGDIAEYIIDVFNQGNVDAYAVEVTDYLNEGYIFDAATNAGWSFDPDNSELLIYTIEGPIAPGDSVRLILNLEVTVPDGANIGSWYNEVEISDADDDTDPDNEDPVDADSYPDQDPDNDNDLVDGPDDDPIYDEDDDNDNVIDEHVDDPFNEGDDDEDDNDAADILVVGGLGDTVWKDVDGDGIQDVDEPGVEGVLVTLTDCEGNELETQVTDSEGFYFFNNLIPGDYQLYYDISGLPEGCAFTYQDAGDDDTIDSDVNEFGFAPCTTIEGGEYDSTFDAGLLFLASLGDYVWHDLDGDGIQDSNEPGIEGVVVNLYSVDGDLIETTTTDADGYYLFDNLYPDTYFVEFIDPDGFESTFSEQGNDDSIDSDITNEIIIQDGGSTTGLYILGPGDNNLTVDAGYYMCVPIGETVWYDVNTNDIEEFTENGINGMLVTLWRQSNGVWEEWDEMYTGHKPGTPSDDGYYKFCAPPGTYYLEFKLPPIGLVQAQPNVGNDLRDSDVTNGNGPGTTNSFTVLSGEELCTIGAGYYPMAEVGNYVWRDANYNGVQEANELPLEGVKVEVYDLDNNKVSEAVTDENGEYQVDYLQQTSYYLRFTPPANYTVTAANAGDDEKDSDVTHAYGANTTNAYTLNSGDKVTSVDAGMALGVLPVEWLYVKATHRGDHNLVEWSTATEINSDYFEVERRVGDAPSFASIGKLKAAGNSQEELTYGYEDGDIGQSGVYYYRIKQVDTDGRVDYSDIVSVTIEGVKATMNLYPNPTTNVTMIKVKGSGAAEAHVSVFTKDGKLMQSGLRLDEVSSGIYELRLDVSSFLPGVYTVQIETTQETWTEKLIVVR